MRPLDEIVSLDEITLLKLDVEGYELPVLRGATRALQRTKVVYCELSASNTQRFGYHPRDAEALLLEAGFVLAHQRDGSWRIASEGVFDTLRTDEQPSTGYNLVAIRRSALPEIEGRLSRDH
jgi:hypothetical protein